MYIFSIWWIMDYFSGIQFFMQKKMKTQFPCAVRTEKNIFIIDRKKKMSKTPKKKKKKKKGKKRIKT